MTNDLIALSAIGVAILFGAMSPGVSFLLVARTAMSSSRRTALSVAAGMGFGALIFAAIALAGLQDCRWFISVMACVKNLSASCKQVYRFCRDRGSQRLKSFSHWRIHAN